MPIEAGAVLELTAKSHKGKNRIRQFGTTWEVVERRDGVSPFAVGIAGERLLIQPVDGDDAAARWLQVADDRDFAIVNVIN